MDCQFCAIGQGKEEGLKVFEDEQVVAVLDDRGVVPGQVTLFTKQHYPIIEVVPNEVLGVLFQRAALFTMSVFDAFRAQGTNVILHNGVPAGQIVPHVSLSVIPRLEKDGFDFSWKPKQLAPGDLEKAAAAIKNEFETLTAPKPAAPVATETKAKEKVENSKDSYLIKHLRRVP